MHFFKPFSRAKSTEDEKVHFIKGNELKVNQVEFKLSYSSLFHSLFLRVNKYFCIDFYILS